MNQRELAFVDAFIAPAGRDKALQTLKRRNVDKKARSKFHWWLSEHVMLDRTLVTELPSSVTPTGLLAIMGNDARASWWVISTTTTDATEVTSEAAIGELLKGVGPVVLCDESGTIAFFGTEYPPGIRYLLRRSIAPAG